MRTNRKIRAPRVRVVGENGEQIGVMTVDEALRRAQLAGLDLVEIAPNAVPPVCKIIDYGKYRYEQTKREKENKKSQHQIKVKEVKFKPLIDQHDLETKLRQARDFLQKGFKVKITCMFRGRQRAHPEIGEKAVSKVVEALSDVGVVESPMKLIGRFLIVILGPLGSKKKSHSSAANPPSAEEKLN